MNRFACLSFFLLLVVVTAAPVQAAFINGDLVILGTKVNTGDAASEITLYNYSYNPVGGTFNAITPTTHVISGLTLPGAGDHEGLLHLSSDRKSLVFGGFQAADLTPNVIASAAPRVIGVVDPNWNLSTVTIGGYTGLGLRSVASTDGKHFWTGGDAGADGGHYYVDASGPLTQTLITALDARGNRIVDGQLWGFSSSNGGKKVGTGLPTSAAGLSVGMNSSPYVKSDAIFLDLNNDGTSETAYSTDGKSLLGKWHYDGSVWSIVGTWDGVKGVVGDLNSLEAYLYNGDVRILAASQLGKVFQFTDTAGLSNTFNIGTTSPPTLIDAPAGASFRGMAILAVPEPMTITLLAAAIPFLVCCRRWRAR